MTLPAFIAAGTAHETTPTWPTHAAGDYGLLFTSTSGLSPSTPSGWTLLLAAQSGPLTVWGRMATSSSETNPTLSPVSGYLWNRILTYSNVNPITPTHGCNPSSGPDVTALKINGYSTTIHECLIVIAVSWALDNAGPLMSGESNSYLSSLTERSDSGTITSDGGGLAIYDGGLATAGAFGITSITASSSTGFNAGVIALVSAQRTLAQSQKSIIVNTRM